MDFSNLLHHLSRPIMVEAVYLAGRYLSHGLSKDQFLKKIASDVKVKYREQSVAVVLGLVEAIEKQFGKPIAQLSAVDRFELAAQVDDVLWSDIPENIDSGAVGAALAALRSQS